MGTTRIQDTSSTGAAADYQTADHVSLGSNDETGYGTGIAGEDHLVVREGGSDLAYQEGQGFGGRALG